MSDEITRLATEAQYILTCDAFRLIMQRLEQDIISSWAEGNLQTPEARDEAYHRIRAAKQFKLELESLLNSMKVSKFSAEKRAHLRSEAGS